MLVKMSPPTPGASISLARSEPDENGCVMIHLHDLDVARSHGWRIAAEEAAEAGQDAVDFAADGAEGDARPAAGKDRKAGRVKL